MIIEEKKAIQAIAKALPAIVSISPAHTTAQHRRKKVYPLLRDIVRRTKHDPFLENGSGFIVDSTGIVVTNIHIIDPHQKKYTVQTEDRTNRVATLVFSDPIHDIAFLTIDGAGHYPHIELGDSSRVCLGTCVLAIGNALGIFQNTVSSGIVSGLSRHISARNEVIQEELTGLIQTDAAINPGNSGGPLITLDGKVIGINSASVARAENIGFAIPINVIKKDLEAFKKNGVVKKAFLGIRYVVLNSNNHKQFDCSLDEGMLVVGPTPHHPGVIKKSPADKAGIRTGDVIRKANGEKLTSDHTLQDFLETIEPQDTILFEIIRKGKKIEKPVRTTTM